MPFPYLNSIGGDSNSEPKPAYDQEPKPIGLFRCRSGVFTHSQSGSLPGLVSPLYSQSGYRQQRQAQRPLGNGQHSLPPTGFRPYLQPLGANRFRNGFIPKQLAQHKPVIGHLLLSGVQLWEGVERMDGGE